METKETLKKLIQTEGIESVKKMIAIQMKLFIRKMMVYIFGIIIKIIHYIYHILQFGQFFNRNSDSMFRKLKIYVRIRWVIP